jgi:hypothetical protein
MALPLLALAQARLASVLLRLHMNSAAGFTPNGRTSYALLRLLRRSSFSQPSMHLVADMRPSGPLVARGTSRRRNVWRRTPGVRQPVAIRRLFARTFPSRPRTGFPTSSPSFWNLPRLLLPARLAESGPALCLRDSPQVPRPVQPTYHKCWPPRHLALRQPAAPSNQICRLALRSEETTSLLLQASLPRRLCSPASDQGPCRSAPVSLDQQVLLGPRSFQPIGQPIGIVQPL